MRSTGSERVRSIGSGPEHYSIGFGQVRPTGSAVPMDSMRSGRAHPTGSSLPVVRHSIVGQGHSIAGVEGSTAVAASEDCAGRRCHSSGTMGTMLDLLRLGTGRQVVGRTRCTPRRTHKSIYRRQRIIHSKHKVHFEYIRRRNLRFSKTFYI